MRTTLTVLAVCVLAATSYAQFTTPDSPGLLRVGTYQQATNGRSFVLTPLTVGGGRLALLNMNWLSWGYGGLVGRELQFNDIGDTGFDSMSYGAGAWASIDFGSLGSFKFMVGGSLHAIFNQERDASYAATLFFGVRG